MKNNNQNHDWTEITFTKEKLSTGEIAINDNHFLDIEIQNGNVKVTLQQANGNTSSTVINFLQDPHFSRNIEGFVSVELIANENLLAIIRYLLRK